MIRIWVPITVLMALAACGVDGEPVPPPDVNAGVTISSSGIYPSLSVGFDAGPVRVWVGG